jgi:hypothetical protein
MAVQNHLRVWFRKARNKQLAVATLALLWVAIVVLTEGTVTVYKMGGGPEEIVTESSFLKAVLYCLPALLGCAVMFWWFGLSPRSEKFSLMGNGRHEIGNPKCPQCFYATTLRCKCGGFRHVEFVYEDYDEDKNEQVYKTATKCDLCGRETWPDYETSNAE